MPRKLKWRHDLHLIFQRAKNSKTETWKRTDIEDLFNVSRPSAQTIMKAVGEIDNIGGVYTLPRAALIAYLERMIKADDPGAEHNQLIATSSPVPRPRRLQVSVPDDLRSVMVSDLPSGITIDQGRIEIVGRNTEEVLQSLYILAQALQNDLDTAAQLIDPPRIHAPELDEDLKALFADLRAREAEQSTPLA
jgi:hypothetical protein